MNSRLMKIGTKQMSIDRKAELGQFHTPAPLADFMASIFESLPPHIHLIDAGAGAGALTMALVSRCCNGQDGTKSIEATLYEIDNDSIKLLYATMHSCEDICSRAGIKFTYTIHCTDFILEATSILSSRSDRSTQPGLYNVAILNPPYRKINSDSDARRWLRTVGIETSNLYTGFLALVQRMLVAGGQLVAITPRSFCNGPYFRPYREELLSQFELERIHVFHSRRLAFRSDSVLQENVVFHAVKGLDQPEDVVISSSSGEAGATITVNTIPFAEIVHPGDLQKFIHIPAASGCTSAKKILAQLHTRLNDLGIKVSTGRVVDYRLKDDLRTVPEPGTVPLLYPCHLSKGSVLWPNLECRKPNAIRISDDTRSSLLPSEMFLLTKRFTSKEQRKRLVACLYDPDLVKTDLIGIENHLNYFHANGHGLERVLAYGLYAYLNSTVVDQYFRMFSGHTQVNATDLRNLVYPDYDTLQGIGRDVKSVDLSQEVIDQIVIKHLRTIATTQLSA